MSVDTLQIFVDEACDPTLFANRRRAIVGTEGCSQFFILGKLEVDDPAGLGQRLEALRQQLMDYPYSGGVPSFDPARGTFFNGQQPLTLEVRFGEQKKEKAMRIGTPKVHTARSRVSLIASARKIPFFIKRVKNFFLRFQFARGRSYRETTR